MNGEYDEISGSVMRRLRHADRFDNYREITAKFDSVGACGHQIHKGDRIGWNRGHGARCADCWATWSAENREADMIEAGYMPSCY